MWYAGFANIITPHRYQLPGVAVNRWKLFSIRTADVDFRGADPESGSNDSANDWCSNQLSVE
jgi:hypothetical protein